MAVITEPGNNLVDSLDSATGCQRLSGCSPHAYSTTP